MTTFSTPRIGFACKWIDTPDQVNGIKPTDDCKQYNTGTTTVAWLGRQSKDVAEQKLWDLMKQNIEATYKLINKVGQQDEHLRMVRISSDLLPVYTHDKWSYFWQLPDVRAYCETHFGKVGERARSHNVRLSMHPGQFTVLASDNANIVNNSLKEFEYHADMARWMGYGREFQDFKINVHISGRKGGQGIRDVYGRLSPEARNCITIENEENSHGLADCLAISDIVPIVLDVHHNWVRDGVYIQPDDPMVRQVMDSWRGVRPTMHYSISREDILVGHSPTVAPDFATLLTQGHKKQKLRAHSDFYWNTAVNDWALSFNKDFDIMCESKGKNLASFALAEHARKNVTQTVV
jgi:UV DNA damage repair endonuclease